MSARCSTPLLLMFMVVWSFAPVSLKYSSVVVLLVSVIVFLFGMFRVFVSVMSLLSLMVVGFLALFIVFVSSFSFVTCTMLPSVDGVGFVIKDMPTVINDEEINTTVNRTTAIGSLFFCVLLWVLGLDVVAVVFMLVIIIVLCKYFRLGVC